MNDTQLMWGITETTIETNDGWVLAVQNPDNPLTIDLLQFSQGHSATRPLLFTSDIDADAYIRDMAKQKTDDELLKFKPRPAAGILTPGEIVYKVMLITVTCPRCGKLAFRLKHIRHGLTKNVAITKCENCGKILRIPHAKL